MSTPIKTSFYDWNSSFLSFNFMMRRNKNGKSCFFSWWFVCCWFLRKSRRDREISSSNKKGVQFDWRKKDINYQVHSIFTYFSLAFTLPRLSYLWSTKNWHGFRFSSLCFGGNAMVSQADVNWLKTTHKLAWKISLCTILRLHLTRALSPILFMVKLILD